MAGINTGGLGEGGFWAANSPDVIGGDGSDDDIQLIAAQAAGDAILTMFSLCTNPGMVALAEMIADEIMSQAEEIASSEGDDGPDREGMLEAISGVHSEDTARSCMSEAVDAAYEILADAAQTISEHEAAEGG